MTINDLYLKIEKFESDISAETKKLSQCQKGCSRCCYVDLSVFQLEADNIKSWFLSLSDEQKFNLREKWLSPLRKTINFHGEEVSSCPFLHHEACTIYEVRPLICRTQGLALKFKLESEELIDICPLNDEMLNLISSKEVLNLDLLNLILSQLEKVESGGQLRDRVKLNALRSSLANSISNPSL